MSWQASEGEGSVWEKGGVYPLYYTVCPLHIVSEMLKTAGELLRTEQLDGNLIIKVYCLYCCSSLKTSIHSIAP